MELAKNIILLLVGAAVFIVGMHMMSSGLKKSTGRGVKKLFKRIQSNRVAGFGIGAAVTALIQSSAATGVIVIGFGIGNNLLVKRLITRSLRWRSYLYCYNQVWR